MKVQIQSLLLKEKEYNGFYFGEVREALQMTLNAPVFVVSESTVDMVDDFEEYINDALIGQLRKKGETCLELRKQ